MRRLLAAATTILVIVGVGVRLLGLSRYGFWLDELWSLWFSEPSLPLSQLFSERLVLDRSPPLYYLLLHYWRTAWGTSEATVRLLSALVGILTLVVAAFQVRRLRIGASAELIFLGLFASSFGAILYAREARSYALLLLLSSMLTLIYLRLAKALGQEGSFPHLLTIKLVVVTLLAGFTHYFGVLLGAAALAAMALESRRKWSELRLVLAYGLSIPVLLGPWAILQYIRVQERFGGETWIGNDLHWYLRLAGTVGHLVFGSLLGLALLTVGLLAVLWRWWSRAEWRSLSEPGGGILLVGRCLFVCCLVVLLSVVISIQVPMATGRNLIVLLPALYLALAVLLAGPSDDSLSERLLKQRWGVSVTAILFGVMAGSCYDLLGAPHEGWREAARYIRGFEECAESRFLAWGYAEQIYPHYLGESNRIELVPVRRGAEISPEARSVDSGPCPIRLWAGHIQHDELSRLFEALEWDRERLDIIDFGDVYVVVEK